MSIHGVKSAKPVQAPILDKLIAEGVARFEAWYEGDYGPIGEYVGTATDGTIVSLGRERSDAEAYLKTHPTPDRW